MKRSTLFAPAGCLLAFVQIGGGLLHVGTIILAYQVSGFGAAVVSSFLPVIAEVYWAIAFYRHVGFWNVYTLAVVAIAVAFAIALGIAFLGGHADEEKEDPA